MFKKWNGWIFFRDFAWISLVKVISFIAANPSICVSGFKHKTFITKGSDFKMNKLAQKTFQTFTEKTFCGNNINFHDYV